MRIHALSACGADFSSVAARRQGCRTRRIIAGMNNFEYHNPTQILFGAGQIASVAKHISPDARVLLLYGGGSIKANGTYDEVKAALSGHVVLEFGGIEPNPHYETLMKAVELVKAENI